MQFNEVKACLTCEFCGSIKLLEPDQDGVALLGSRSTLMCPECKTALEEAASCRQQFLCCPRCRGLLLPMNIFVGLIDAMRLQRKGPPEPPHPFDPDNLDRVFACPQCGARMDTHPYAGPGNVALSSCESCHLNWLDHGSLRHIVAAPDHERDEE